MYFCVVLCILCVVLCILCVVLCIFVLFYVFLCCSMYFCVVLCIVVLFYVFFVLLYVFLCCSTHCLFCVVLCIVCVYMCTELLPPGGYPIAVKYIISYHKQQTPWRPANFLRQACPQQTVISVSQRNRLWQWHRAKLTQIKSLRISNCYFLVDYIFKNTNWKVERGGGGGGQWTQGIRVTDTATTECRFSSPHPPTPFHHQLFNKWREQPLPHKVATRPK